MGDSIDGSSTAAQSAQPDGEEQRRSGFLARLFGAGSGEDEQSDDDQDHPGEEVNGTASSAMLGMMNLRRMRVEDVLIPKAEIVAVPMDIEKDALVEVFRESGLTRLPVFEGTLDSPVGMVHLKDFALTHGFNGGSATYDMADLLRPVLFAPPSMPIGVLLTKMQTDRTHMALVIDEYGGVDGLVTIEDLIEQVIGEIEDEHDLEEGALWLREGPDTYVVEARAPLEEFEEAVGVKLNAEADDDEIDTLGGLVFLLSGRVPARNEVIRHPSGAEFDVVDADPRRIKRLRVRLPAGSDQAAQASQASGT